MLVLDLDMERKLFSMMSVGDWSESDRPRGNSKRRVRFRTPERDEPHISITSVALF